MDSTKHPSPPLAGGILPLLLLFAGCLVSVFLAGGPRQGGEGAFLVTAGLVMILFRPSRATSWWLWFGGLLVLLFCAAALLPSGWFPVPPWKQVLTALPAISLPPTVTCDPYAVAFWLAVLAASIATALFVLGQPLQSGALRAIAFVAVGGCTAYAVTAMAAWIGGWHYPFFKQESWAQPAFGFFTNRNQTAGFLLTGAILSLGMIRRGYIGRRWLYVLAGVAAFTVLCYALLFLSASRGGLVFLAIGSVLWLAGLGRYRSFSLVVVAVLIAMLIGISFIRSESALMERFLGNAPESARSARVEGMKEYSVTSGGRSAIWLDTLGIIREQPLAGSGLGSYHFVYPYHARRSFSEMTALHAESSWLTLAAEAGIPALLAVLGCLAVLISGLPRLERLSGRDWPLRWGFLAAFFAELLHGLVDVPLHKPELGWWLLLLGGIGFAPIPGNASDDCFRASARLQRILLIPAGIVSLILGGWMLAAQLGKAPAMPPFAADESEKRIVFLYRDVPDFSPEEVAPAIRREMVCQPVNSRLHYLLGSILLRTPDGLAGAKAEFQAEQALSPNDPFFLKAEGLELAPYDPLAALASWKEALRRRLRLDDSPNCPLRRSEGLFYSMITDARNYPELAARLGELSRLSPDLRLQWLSQPSSDPSEIMDAARDTAFLKALDPRQKMRLLELWYQRGDHAVLAAYLETHPELARESVPARALLMTEGPDPRQGCQLLRDTYHIAIPEADADSVIRPADGEVPSDPLKAASYYMLRGNTVTARRILTAPGAPGGAEAQRLRAALAIREGRWKESVQQLLGYLHATNSF